MEARSDSLTGKMAAPAGTDLVIVSAHGRGNWLAAELAGRGWKVTLTDVTKSLGTWMPEDAEGPFGFFNAADLPPSVKTWLEKEGETKEVEGGFTLWLKDGPLEFAGPVSRFQEFDADLGSYLKSAEKKKISRKEFRSVWPAHFAHQFASPVIEENHRALNEGEPLPLTAPFFIRERTQESLDTGLRLCKAAGVDVRDKANIKDLRLTDKLVDAIEINDERAGTERARVFVWMLTSHETQACGKTLAGVLYPNGVPGPELCWLRWRVELEGTLSTDALPAHLVAVNEPYLPWMNANMFVLRKRKGARDFDLWMRTPIRVRGDEAAAAALGEEALAHLSKRLPQLKARITQKPIDFEKRAASLAPKHPIYTATALSGLSTLKSKNLFYSSPEQWGWLDAVGSYRDQTEMIEKLEKLRAQWLAVERKRIAAQERNAAP